MKHRPLCQTETPSGWADRIHESMKEQRKTVMTVEHKNVCKCEENVSLGIKPSSASFCARSVMLALLMCRHSLKLLKYGK